MKRAAFFLLISLLTPFVLRSQTPADGSDIAYGPLESERLDYWEAAQDNSPIVLIISGKDWSGGGKDMAPWREAVSLFHENGYAVVIIDYKSSSDPDYKGFPQQPSNLACAIGWTREHASLLKGDPDRLILFGAAAGAHLASLHALHPINAEENACDYSSADMEVAGVIALSGIYDFRVVPKESNTHDLLLTMVGDSTAYWESAQPVKVQPSGNPDACFLLLHGTRDAFAGNSQPASFEKYLKNNNYCVEVDILEDRESDLINDLAGHESWVAERIIGFANSISRHEDNPPTAVLPAGDRSKLKVYPNPTEGDLLIVLEAGSYRFAELILTGIDGREILHTSRQSGEQLLLDVSNYPRGTYILNVVTDRDKHQHKVMIR